MGGGPFLAKFVLFCLFGHLYLFFFFFTKPLPKKPQQKYFFGKICPILELLGTFFFFFFLTKPPPKIPKKILFLAKFAHFGTFGHFLELFFLTTPPPPPPPKKKKKKKKKK